MSEFVTLCEEKYLSLLCTAHIYLPQALVTDILSRLYVKTVFNCRCVSKEWLSIISDHQFTHLRASRSPAGVLIKSYALLITSNKVYFIQLEQCFGSDFRHERPVPSATNSSVSCHSSYINLFLASVRSYITFCFLDLISVATFSVCQFLFAISAGFEFENWTYMISP